MNITVNYYCNDHSHIYLNLLQCHSYTSDMQRIFLAPQSSKVNFIPIGHFLEALIYFAFHLEFLDQPKTLIIESVDYK